MSDMIGVDGDLNGADGLKWTYKGLNNWTAI